LAPLKVLAIKVPPDGESHHLMILPVEEPLKTEFPVEHRTDGVAETVGDAIGFTVIVIEILGLPEHTLNDSA
jgi:hypothetical protein